MSMSLRGSFLFSLSFTGFTESVVDSCPWTTPTTRPGVATMRTGSGAASFFTQTLDRKMAPGRSGETRRLPKENQQ